ncbi:hypothetical protein FB451DRAFT_1509584 [Mycena latifolia]|nr:hypothetical protein FB451DRAFT_1509584 [Mycena latifolia]
MSPGTNLTLASGLSTQHSAIVCYWHPPKPGKQPPIRRAGGVLAHFCQHIKNPPPRNGAVATSLPVDVPGDEFDSFPPHYNMLGPIYQAFPSLISIRIRRRCRIGCFPTQTQSGDDLLICHLRHPGFPRTNISLMFERHGHTAEGNTGPSPLCSACSSGHADDLVTVSTDESDAQLISGKTYLVCRTLTFTGAQTAPSLSIAGRLTLAKLVSNQNPIAGLTYRSSVFYGTVIYSSLEKIFDGHSEEVLPLLNPYDAEVTAGRWICVSSHKSGNQKYKEAALRIRNVVVAQIAANMERAALLKEKAALEAKNTEILPNKVGDARIVLNEQGRLPGETIVS